MLSVEDDMAIQDVLRLIDEEISKLQRARVLILDEPASELQSKRRGRPKGSGSKNSKTIVPIMKKVVKRVISAEGKARIAAAQKARWAAQNTGASLKKAAKTTSEVVARNGTKKRAAKKVSAKKNGPLAPSGDSSTSAEVSGA